MILHALFALPLALILAGSAALPQPASLAKSTMPPGELGEVVKLGKALF